MAILRLAKSSIILSLFSPCPRTYIHTLWSFWSALTAAAHRLIRNISQDRLSLILTHTHAHTASQSKIFQRRSSNISTTLSIFTPTCKIIDDDDSKKTISHVYILMCETQYVLELLTFVFFFTVRTVCWELHCFVSSQRSWTESQNIVKLCCSACLFSFRQSRARFI